MNIKVVCHARQGMGRIALCCPQASRNRAPGRRGYASHATHYDILDVSRNADMKEIKARFYELSRKYHPDVSPGSAKRFTEINAAYAVLKDEALRRDYDRSLPRDRGPLGTGENGMRTASGLSRRKTRPMGTPPSSPFRAPSSPASNRPAGFAFGTNPAAEGDVRNQHFAFDEHRERHSTFDSRYNLRLQEELSRRNAELKDNWIARFLGISGLIFVIVVLTGGISSVRAEVHENPQSKGKHEITWSEAMRARQRLYEHQFWKK